jgi:hypothetical protein
LLLDGQQRLTSLSAIIRGEPISVRGKQREIDILFNLEHPDKFAEFTEVFNDEDSPGLEEDAADEMEEEEEISVLDRIRNMTFVVASRNIAQLPNWVSVSKIFQSDNEGQLLQAAGVNTFDDPRFKKYSARIQKLRSIRDYQYVMHVLPRDLSYEEVAEIFVRVNSLGVKLRGSDLALAQITARWRNSLELLEKFQDECEEKWITLDLGLLVRAMVVFATDQSRFSRVSSVSIELLKKGWEDAKDGIRFAINFLRTNADIEDESLLSSPLFFITIAYFSHIKKQKLSQSETRSLLYWFLVANARGRYSRGSTETLLDADLALIKRGGGPADLLNVLRQQFGRLDFEHTDFVGRGAGSPLFSLVFLALKAKKATDWRSGLGLSLTHQGRYHYIQYHHIFPKSLLKDHYDRQAINEIANMAFISGRMNREISSSAPYSYFPGIIKDHGAEALTLHCIPPDQELHRIENYLTFLKVRRKMLADEVNLFLEKSKNG